MEYHPDLENLDEDGYTQLDFSSRSVPRRPVISKKEILSSSCPANWIMHENSCYLLSTSEDSWERSKAQCSRQGANLLKIESSNELEFIKTQISFKPNKSFWMGLSRHQTNGPWLWEDGSMFSSYLFQIITTATQENSSHNCVWIHSSVIYDQPCSLPSSSICEKKLSM
ncbi:PREDICTED: C-type lectin domain family 7 member A-like [Hipposideros armiger]|uniref:C-type lectin domain family 7 member A-like n=1 Tax=Hipposideros armiger TaxID=186990 RepID=A0A8B7QDG6_HIPAR|nr:PREDICTED: C-type lectin domain family 7 member A-like [Hipposideros armiger]